ncbi:MAG: hypothetical protein E4H32_03240 [Nitrospirales bacterium]|nr:MAG: hypothetical protein E4H32_03240 [Nitrospirales bacterium]
MAIEFRLKDEQGKIRSSTMKGSACTPLEDTMIRGTRYVRRHVSLPVRLRVGYYDLMVIIKLGSRVLEAKSFVIAAPQRCYLPPGSKENGGLGCSCTAFVLGRIGASEIFVIWNES